jgi:hypothetical protein
VAEKRKVAFLLYYDWEKLFVSLDNDEDAGILIKALFAYVKRGEVPKFNGTLKTVFAYIVDKIDSDLEKWADKCEKRSKAAKKRWEDMQNIQLHANAYNCMQMHANVGDNDYDNDYEYDNDYDDDMKYNIKAEKPKKPKEPDLKKMIVDYSDNTELQEALLFFVKSRKALKAPMSDRALTLSLNKLDKLGKDDAEKVAIVNQSIERGWKGFFPIGETQTKPESETDIDEYKSVINKFLY